MHADKLEARIAQLKEQSQSVLAQPQASLSLNQYQTQSQANLLPGQQPKRPVKGVATGGSSERNPSANAIIEKLKNQNQSQLSGAKRPIIVTNKLKSNS